MDWDVVEEKILDEDQRPLIKNAYEKQNLKDKLPLKTFEKIAKLDPYRNEGTEEIGQYTLWLTRMYLRMDPTQQKQFVEEDLPGHFGEAIKTFHTKKQRIPDPRLRNIEIYKTPQELYTVIHDHELEDVSKRQKAVQIKREGITLQYEDEDVMCLTPLTYDAMKLIGGGTRWCTTNQGNWRSYTDKGPLFDFIPKDRRKFMTKVRADSWDEDEPEIDALQKWQWHPATMEFADFKDDHVCFFDWMLHPPSNPNVIKFVARATMDRLRKWNPLPWFKVLEGTSSSYTHKDVTFTCENVELKMSFADWSTLMDRNARRMVLSLIDTSTFAAKPEGSLTIFDTSSYIDPIMRGAMGSVTPLLTPKSKKAIVSALNKHNPGWDEELRIEDVLNWVENPVSGSKAYDLLWDSLVIPTIVNSAALAVAKVSSDVFSKDIKRAIKELSVEADTGIKGIYSDEGGSLQLNGMHFAIKCLHYGTKEDPERAGTNLESVLSSLFPKNKAPLKIKIDPDGILGPRKIDKKLFNDYLQRELEAL